MATPAAKTPWKRAGSGLGVFLPAAGRPLCAVLWVALLLPAAYLAWTVRDMPHFGYLHDDGMYWVSAKSLAEGGGYRIQSLPGQPYETKYPPLLPLMGSLAWRMRPSFPDNLEFAILLAWASFVLYIWAARTVLAQWHIGESSVWLLSGLLAINPYFLRLSTSIATELPFSICLFAALLVAERAMSTTRGTRWAALGGGLAGLAYLLRTAGIAVVISGLLLFALRRQWRKALGYAVGCAPMVLGWMYWVHIHSALTADRLSLYYTSYFGFLRTQVGWKSLPAAAVQNADHIWIAAGNLMLGGAAQSNFLTWLARAIAAVALFGVIRRVRATRLYAYPLFAAVYAVVLIFWHYEAGEYLERFMVPLWPLLIGGIWAETDHRARSLEQRAKLSWRSVSVLVLVCAAVSLSLRSSVAVWRGFPAKFGQYRAARHSNYESYGWITGNTPSSARFLAPDDASFYLGTGRPAWDLFVAVKVLGSTGVESFLVSRGIDYVFVTDTDFDTNVPTEEHRKLQQEVGAWKEVRWSRRIPGGVIFRIGGTEAAAGPPRTAVSRLENRQ